jgi:hypothetical protein
VIGRFAGWFFYPCWASGILFGILIGLVGLAAVFTHAGSTNWDSEEVVVLVALFGGLLFPAVWQVFLFRGEGQRVSHYLLLLVGSFILLGVLAALSDSMNSGDFLWFFAWNPLAFIAMLDESSVSETTLLVGAVVVDLVLILILFVRAVTEIKKAAPVIQEAGESIQNTV